jgi:hypothetical protein
MAPLAVGSAFAQDQAIVGIQTVTHYSIDGRITAVDTAAHKVTVTSAEGTVRQLEVRPSVANFANTRVGDLVALNIEDTRAFVLSGPGVATPAARDTAVGIATTRGQKMAGAAVSSSINNWVVVGADAAAHTITLVNPSGGEVRTYDVTTPEGRQQLPRVKRGDNLTEINRRLAVVSITPKSRS